MVSYTIFVVFYIPCLATMITIKNELGVKNMWLITALTVVVALVAALIVRGFSCWYSRDCIVPDPLRKTKARVSRTAQDRDGVDQHF
jgi:hypothetical protein